MPSSLQYSVGATWRSSGVPSRAQHGSEIKQAEIIAPSSTSIQPCIAKYVTFWHQVKFLMHLLYDARCRGMVAVVVVGGCRRDPMGSRRCRPIKSHLGCSPITQITQAGQDHTGWHKITQRHHMQAANNDYKAAS